MTRGQSASAPQATASNAVPRRLLLGPGPSQVDPEVIRALTLPPLGHLDPALLELMSGLQDMLRDAFRTRNRLTIALSGTGTSGMEAALVNVVEPGDPLLVAVAGYFGDRLCQIAARLGARVTRVDGEWGRAFEPGAVEAEIARVRPAVACVVHAETSTGVRQDVAAIARAAHEVGALLVADAVTSLGGQPVEVDEWGIDVCYSGSQKCLGAPSGLAPFTMNERALDKVRARKSPVSSFYLDALLLQKYWEDRQYHHTISSPLVYALHAALTGLFAEGIEARWERHRLNHVAFRAGIEALGLSFLPGEDVSLWPLNAVLLPDGTDEAAIRMALLMEHGIEIGGGLGPLKGRLLRVGLMGYGSQQIYVLELLAALSTVLEARGFPARGDAALAAAFAAYDDDRR